MRHYSYGCLIEIEGQYYQIVKGTLGTFYDPAPKIWYKSQTGLYIQKVEWIRNSYNIFPMKYSKYDKDYAEEWEYRLNLIGERIKVYSDFLKKNMKFYQVDSCWARNNKWYLIRSESSTSKREHFRVFSKWHSDENIFIKDIDVDFECNKPINL